MTRASRSSSRVEAYGGRMWRRDVKVCGGASLTQEEEEEEEEEEEIMIRD